MNERLQRSGLIPSAAIVPPLARRRGAQADPVPIEWKALQPLLPACATGLSGNAASACASAAVALGEALEPLLDIVLPQHHGRSVLFKFC